MVFKKPKITTVKIKPKQAFADDMNCKTCIYAAHMSSGCSLMLAS